MVSDLEIVAGMCNFARIKKLSKCVGDVVVELKLADNHKAEMSTNNSSLDS